ncbi:MAG: hypothetical protein QM800_12720 [Paludibacter sp.]
MTIIQNLACLSILVNPADHRIPMSFDIIKDKKINGIYLFCGDWDLLMKLPYKDAELSVIGPIGIEDYFLNLTDSAGNQFVKNFSFNNNILSISDHNFDEITIDRVIDIYKSYISYNIMPEPGIREILMLVFYQTQNFQKFDNEINGSFTVEMPINSEYQDICLKNVIPSELTGKKIKKIIPEFKYMHPSSYLDLYCTDGKHIQNLPVTLLEIQDTKEFYFDNIEINVTKSYFRQRGKFSDILYAPMRTVYDRVKLTFIY